MLLGESKDHASESPAKYGGLWVRRDEARAKKLLSHAGTEDRYSWSTKLIEEGASDREVHLWGIH